MAVLHITPMEFYQLTPIEFSKALEVVRQIKLTEQRVQYEVMRELALQIWNSAGKVLAHTIIDAREIMPFPWDEKREGEVQSIEGMRNQMLSIAKFFGNSKKGKS